MCVYMESERTAVASCSTFDNHMEKFLYSYRILLSRGQTNLKVQLKLTLTITICGFSNQSWSCWLLTTAGHKKSLRSKNRIFSCIFVIFYKQSFLLSEVSHMLNVRIKLSRSTIIHPLLASAGHTWSVWFAVPGNKHKPCRWVHWVPLLISQWQTVSPWCNHWSLRKSINPVIYYKPFILLSASVRHTAEH